MDVTHYDLRLKVDPYKKTIGGTVNITFVLINKTDMIEIDLLDQFNVSGTFLIDTIKPIVTNIAINSSNSVLAFLSEDIDPSSAQNTNNYIIDNGIGNPNLICWIRFDAEY